MHWVGRWGLGFGVELSDLCSLQSLPVLGCVAFSKAFACEVLGAVVSVMCGSCVGRRWTLRVCDFDVCDARSNGVIEVVDVGVVVVGEVAEAVVASVFVVAVASVAVIVDVIMVVVVV